MMGQDDDTDEDTFFKGWITQRGMSIDFATGVTTVWNDDEVTELPPRRYYSWEGDGHDVFWGSHGCHLPKGHRGWCHCDHDDSRFPYGGRRARKPPEWWDDDDEAWVEWRWQFFFGNHEDENDDAKRMNAKMRRAYRFPLVLVLPVRIWWEGVKVRRRFREPTVMVPLDEAKGLV